RAVAVIGFGSGMTTHFVLGNSAIDFVDTIEIEPAMVEAAHHFRPLVERAFTDPRSHIIIDDAKSYFATNQKRYDIIISEPSNPWVSGVASLFTEEFYQFIPRHLTDNGLFVQWVHVYEITPALINTILKAMLPHFADVQIFQSSRSDWIILASPREKMMALPEVTIPTHWDEKFLQEIARRGLDSASDLYSLYLGDKELLQTYTTLYPQIGRNSDFFPVLQLAAPQARFRKADGGELLRLKFAPWPLLEVMTLWQPLPEKPQSEAQLKHISYAKAVMKAHALRAALTGQPLNGLKDHISQGENMIMEHIRLLGLACRLDSLVTESLVTFTNVAAQTIPYLSKEGCQELWITQDWLPCPPKNPLLHDYLRFLAAVAARDHRNTVEAGEQILAAYGKDLFTEEMKTAGDYVTGAVQIAAYALGEYEKVLALEEKFRGKQKKDFARAFLMEAAKGKIGEKQP
ncbi:MAG: hypothetical protein FWF29_11395, partial [Treponema sp.]|nr:hypothetical protein [Treponema sp.]